jgi:hypothetical protein
MAPSQTLNRTAPQADTEELWRRIAFSILITNVDDHLRNHGFLHADRGQWRLAPAFDVNPFPVRSAPLPGIRAGDARSGAGCANRRDAPPVLGLLCMGLF